MFQPSLKRLVKSNSSVKYEEDEDENDSEEVEPDAVDDEDEEDQEAELEDEEEDFKDLKGRSGKTQLSNSQKRKGSDESNSLDRFGFSAVAKEKDMPKKRDINVDIGKARTLPPVKSSRSSARGAASSKKMEIAEDSPTEDGQRVQKSRVSKRNKADDDSEFDEVDKNVRKSSRTRQFSKDYADPHSDDEFPEDVHPGTSREGRTKPKKTASKSQAPKAAKKSKSESESDASNDDQVLSIDDSKSGSNEENEGDDSVEEVVKGDSDDEEYDEDDDDESSGVEKSSDDIDYKIQHVLARQSMTPTKWRDICSSMNTRYVHRKYCTP